MRALSHILLLLLPFAGWGQEEVETVKIKKEETWLFRGQQEALRNCYIYVDQDATFYLVNLTIPAAEVREWFEKRKDSQNIYKGMLDNGQYKTLNLVKENEPGISISFYYERKEKSEIQLISMEDGRTYTFQLVNK